MSDKLRDPIEGFRPFNEGMPGTLTGRRLLGKAPRPQSIMGKLKTLSEEQVSADGPLTHCHNTSPGATWV